MTLAILFAGCSSGTTSQLSGSSPGSGASSQSKGRATVKGRIFIPALTKAAAAAARRTALSTRSPKYVSISTKGVAIKTVTAAGAAIDNTAFSTNPNDDPNCSTTMTGPPGTNCTFTLGALAPTTTFLVTAYDAEPSVPTGGSSSVPTGNALSTATSVQTIVDGGANTVFVALGGVVTSYTLTSSANSHVSFDGSFSLPATNVAQSLTIAITAFDADNNEILTGTGTPYDNPISFTATESGGGPNGTPISHTMLTLNTMTSSGTATTQTASPYTSAYTGDTFTLTYDGINDPYGASYADSIAGTIGTGTDAYTNMPITPATANNGTLLFTPLTVYADVDTTTAMDAFDGTSTPPAITFSIPPSPTVSPAALYVSQSQGPTGAPTYTLTADTSNTTQTCMGVAPSAGAALGEFIFNQPTAPTLDSPPAAGSPQTCLFNLSDGQSTLPIGIYNHAYGTPTTTSKVRAPAAQSVTHTNAVLK